MTSAPRFCENCGGALGVGARFCGACGKPVQAVQAAPPVPPAPAPQPVPVAPAPAVHPLVAQQHAAATSGEPVLGVIPGLQQKKGFMGLKIENWTLVVTPQRLIFAELSNKMMNDAVNQARLEAKAQGKGWFGQVGAQMGWMSRLVTKYANLAPAVALGESPKNFTIPNSQVSQVRLRKEVDSDDDSTTVTYRVEFHAAGGKYDFVLTGGNLDSARQVLQSALGAVVR